MSASPKRYFCMFIIKPVFFIKLFENISICDISIFWLPLTICKFFDNVLYDYVAVFSWVVSFFKACVCYFSLFLKEQYVSWLFRAKYFEIKFTYSCFIFLMFHKRLFSPELPRTACLLKSFCFEKITVYVIETMLVM